MPASRSRPVVYDLLPGEDGWEVRSGREHERYATKAEALAGARAAARANVPSRVRVHGSDGRFQTEHAYGVRPQRSGERRRRSVPAQTWPDCLWVVRHGESAGNVARDEANAAGLAIIDIAHRDVDVPLSPLGEEQSLALGHWFAAMPQSQRPEVVLASPYRRARQTAECIRDAFGLTDDAPELVLDERLREKEFGILDRLTRLGIEQQHPEQAEFRRILGKFYHRPPGGESWCDVILRLRSALDSVSLHHQGRRVLIVAHQVVVLCLRYLLENLTEEEILAIDAQGDVANCSVTEYRFNPAQGRDGGLVLERYNFVAPLQSEGTRVTAEPDAPVATR